MSSQIGSSNGNTKVQPHPWWHIPTDLSNVITLKEACATYHYSRNSILRKIYKHQIKGFKMDNRWYVITGSLRVNTRTRKNKSTSS